MKKGVLAGLIASLISPVMAQNVVVFGDSLSDIGQSQWKHKASYYHNHTAQPLYNELLSQRLGSTITASSRGGRNYAYSGGVAVATNSAAAERQPNVVVQQQIEHYLAKGATPADLHLVWVGGNDLAAMLKRASTQSDAVGAVLSGTMESAAASAKQWLTLQQAGITQAVFPTVPNVVYTPLLFQLFGETAAAKFQQQALAFVPAADAEQVAKAFSTAFQAYSQQLNTRQQRSLADFEQARLDVLRKSVSALYQSPMGGVLARHLDPHKLTALLIQQYQATAQQATQATALFNQYTTKALNQAGGNVVRLDTEAIFHDLLARPAAYGLTNTTGVACASTTDAPCQPTLAQAETMLFADGFHPNTLAHQVMADYIYAALNAPKQMAILAHLADMHSETQLDFARHHSNGNRLHRQTAGTVAVFAHRQQRDAGDSTHLGLTAQFDPQWQFHATFSEQKQQGHLADTQATSRSKGLHTHLRYDADRWWVGSGIQLNQLDFQTQRTTLLGRATHRQQAETDGATLAFSLFGGYEWQFGAHQLAALGDVTFSHSKLAPFSEQPQGALQFQFDTQRINRLKSGLGAAYRYQGQAFQPFFSARWVKAWRDRPQTVTIGLNGSQYPLTFAQADRNWLNLQAGANYQFAKMPLTLTAYLSQDLARQPKIGDTTAHVGLQYRF